MTRVACYIRIKEKKKKPLHYTYINIKRWRKKNNREKLGRIGLFDGAYIL